MADAGRSSRGLSARITTAAFLIGGLTVMAAIVIALSSQSRLTNINIQSRDTLLVQAIEQRIVSRLRNISTMVEKSAVGSGTVKSGMLDRMRVVYESSPSQIDALLVSDHEGNLQLALTGGQEPPDTARGLPAYVAAVQGRTGYITVHHDDTRWELWHIRTAVDEAGQPLYVMTRADVNFLGEVIEAVAEDQARRSVLLMDGAYLLAASSQARQVDIGSAIWVDGDDYVGSVKVRSLEGENLSGHFRDVGLAEGISWRILILESGATMYYNMVTLALPLIGVLTAGGAIALLAAWGMTLGMTRPLRDLQRTARAAASGAYVRPLNVTRKDEIGEVSKAFNAVALRLNALHDLSQLLASASHLDQVLDGIQSAMGPLVGGGAVVVYLLDDQGTLLPVRTRGREVTGARPLALHDSELITEALERQEPTLFEGPGELCDQLPGYSGEDMTAAAIPLAAHGETLGAVLVARYQSNPFSEAEIEMLRTFSAQAALAVHTSQLFEYESEARRVADALRKVAEELVRPERLETATAAVERILRELFSASEVRIILTNPSAVGLEPSARPEDPELLAIFLEALARSAEPGRTVVRKGDGVREDAILSGLGADRAWVLHVASETDHPAVLAICLQDRNLAESELVAAGAIADELALALDNAYFYERALKRADNLENIFHISQAVGSSLQINVVLNRVLEVVQKILAADALALLSYDPLRRTLSMSMGRGSIPKGFTELELKSGDDIPGEVFLRGEPVALHSMRKDNGGVAGMAASVGLRSLLAVPLVARGRSIGVLMVFASHEGGFAEEDVNLLRTFAFQAALAIDTARLYGKEHDTADVLQKSILPEALPELPELESGSVYAPAGENIDIGGDYYDVFRSPDGYIWVAMGDVCGKGIHAATKTSMIKYIVRALACAGLQPSEIVSQANDMIANTGEASDIVTVWVGRYDREESMLSWSNGGHPPSLIRRADGSIEELAPTGALLGAQQGTHYDQIESSLCPGDLLLLYTDGVTEARIGNVFFGVERIKKVLGAPGSTAEVSRAVLLAVREFTRGELRDDVAVLAVAPREPAMGG